MSIFYFVLMNKDEHYEIVQPDFDGVLYYMDIVFAYKDMAIEYADFLNRKANNHIGNTDD
jgi:hypothetical protein